MTNAFWLRRATVDDASVMLSIIRGAFEEYRGQLDPPSGAHTESAEKLKTLLAREHGMIAGIGDDAAGCVFFAQLSNHAYLHRLAVLPAYRRLALGRAMVCNVEMQARAFGCPEVRLGVRLQLPRNQAFYTGMGYHILRYGSHPGYDQPTFVTMVKNVREPDTRHVEVWPYETAWADDARRESELLRLILGSEMLDIHHVGSTSVPGLEAKPVIDLMPVVTSIDEIARYEPMLAAVGYVAKGEYGIPGRRYFAKGGRLPTHHVHIFQAGHVEIEKHLVFRDYLRNHPDRAAEYGALKRRLAHQFPNDSAAYTEGKAGLIAELLADAYRESGA